MVRPEVIRKRLNKLDEYLNILKNIRRYTFSGTPWSMSTSKSTVASCTVSCSTIWRICNP